MSIEKTNLEEVNESDLIELITVGVPEGRRIDYKRMAYKTDNESKLDLLKDVSALANTDGGHLVLGMEEKRGLPTRLVGVDTNLDAERTRIEQIIHGGIEPQIPNVETHSVKCVGDDAVVIRVGKSWNAPHRITGQMHNRYWRRNSSGGNYEPTSAELRQMFTERSTALEQARDFHVSRCIEVDVDPEAPAQLILHLIPVSSLVNEISLDLKAARGKFGAFAPIGGGFTNPRVNFHGLGSQVSADQPSYTQLFRNGILECVNFNLVDVDAIPSKRIISAAWLENRIFERLTTYCQALGVVGPPPPYFFYLTFQNVEGVIFVTERHRGMSPPFTLDTMHFPVSYIESCESADVVQKAVRPTFDAIWNAAGYIEDEFYDDTGSWMRQ